MLMTLQGASPGRIPELMGDLESLGKMEKLPIKKRKELPASGKGEALEVPKSG